MVWLTQGEMNSFASIAALASPYSARTSSPACSPKVIEKKRPCTVVATCAGFTFAALAAFTN